MLAIQKAEYISDYKIQLAFNNGKNGIADLEQTLKKDSRTLFIELQNITISNDSAYKMTL